MMPKQLVYLVLEVPDGAAPFESLEHAESYLLGQLEGSGLDVTAYGAVNDIVRAEGLRRGPFAKPWTVPG